MHNIMYPIVSHLVTIVILKLPTSNPWRDESPPYSDFLPSLYHGEDKPLTIVAVQTQAYIIIILYIYMYMIYVYVIYSKNLPNQQFLPPRHLPSSAPHRKLSAVRGAALNLHFSAATAQVAAEAELSLAVQPALSTAGQGGFLCLWIIERQLFWVGLGLYINYNIY